MEILMLYVANIILVSITLFIIWASEATLKRVTVCFMIASILVPGGMITYVSLSIISVLVRFILELLRTGRIATD